VARLEALAQHAGDEVNAMQKRTKSLEALRARQIEAQRLILQKIEQRATDETAAQMTRLQASSTL
jgi:flagellar biosynthesis chaperone FliJ